MASLGVAAPQREPPSCGLCAATALCNVGTGALIATLVPLVLLVTGRLGAGNAGFAAAMTGYTVGSLAGGTRHP